VAQEIKRQNDQIKGSGGNPEQGEFPELQEPHLVLASAAGIETSTPESTHIASQEHNALTSGGHTSVSAGQSLLVSARKAVRLAAFEEGMRLIAANSDIDIEALRNNINILAKLDIKAEANRITITAKEEVVINGGTSYTKWNASGIVSGTPGLWREHAGSHSLMGADSLPVVPFNPSGCQTKESADSDGSLDGA
jgi:type VI secretion system secreted protein VgrG